MNKQLRDEWVKALRSGEYKQARGRLQGDDGYCCLGVLCRVSGFPVDEYDGRLIGLDLFCQTTRFHALARNLPSTDLVDMNDEDCKTFPEIADWIEQNIPAEDAP